jgi:gamma-glutamyltranspeptidase/glutathione hydrolase
MRAGRSAPSRDAGKNTTHFAVIDAEGNAVSNSYTMNLRYGSKWAVAGAGFLLNGSIDSFSFIEGQENYYGVIGNRPNLFEPGKRPASNMAPVLVTGPKGVEAVLGTPGGPTIPTTMADLLLATLVHGKRPEAVIGASRLHHQGWPDALAHEPGFDRPELLATLAGMGYPLKDKHELIADVQGVWRSGGEYLAVSDYRREGKALALPD